MFFIILNSVNHTLSDNVSMQDVRCLASLVTQGGICKFHLNFIRLNLSGVGVKVEHVKREQRPCSGMPPHRQTRTHD